MSQKYTEADLTRLAATNPKALLDAVAETILSKPIEAPKVEVAKAAEAPKSEPVKVDAKKAEAEKTQAEAAAKKVEAEKKAKAEAERKARVASQLPYARRLVEEMNAMPIGGAIFEDQLSRLEPEAAETARVEYALEQEKKRAARERRR